MTDHFTLLTGLDLFSAFEEAALRSLLATSDYRVLTFNEGQIVHLQHETCHHLEIILSGHIVVHKLDAAGNILTVEDLTVGDILGASLIFSSRNIYPLTSIAETDAVLFRLGKDTIVKLSQENVGFMQALLRTISDRTLMMTDRIDAISLKTIREKITDYLRLQYSIQNTPTITLPLAKKQLAERFGIQRTSLSRELDLMRKDGLLNFHNRQITLLDKDYFSL